VAMGVSLVCPSEVSLAAAWVFGVTA
jgi:hypothetical protein